MIFCLKGLKDSRGLSTPGTHSMKRFARKPKGRKLTWINPTPMAPQNRSALPAEIVIAFPFCDPGRVLRFLTNPAREIFSGEDRRKYGHALPLRRPELERSPKLARFRSDKRVPAIGLPSTVKMDFDFWWRKECRPRPGRGIETCY